ncbi:MAG: glycosyltransferase family 4 protein, partial [Candidatus Humimicrobiaceae bacterium]
MEKKKIKQLVVSTYDIEGGASRSSYRIFKALEKIGFSSKMLVQYKSSIESSIITSETSYQKILGKIRTRLDLFPLRKYKNFSNTPWSICWLPHNISKEISKINPDIVNLNWVGRGFLPIAELPKIKYPIIWTFHDMWGFTGGCHYAFECKKYKDSCGNCPQLGSNKENDISRKIWGKKKKFWKNLNITIVSPSRWLADCARESSLFGNTRIEVIPYVIDTEIFKPIDKEIARYILNIPKNKKIILFGGLSATSDKRKGFQYLIPALKELEKDKLNQQSQILIFGALKPKNNIEINYDTRYLGFVYDDITLSIIYSAADVFVMPSIQDNFPNTVLESLACGTPVVGFSIGGNPDMIEHKKNGYLVKPFEIDDLVEGIKWVLSGDKLIE